MTIKYVIGAIIAMLISSSQMAAASSEFTGDNFEASQSNRPPINPDFDPDYSCLFDTYQAKCIPGSEQECPEGLGGSNDDQTCVPDHDKCPEGYHSSEADETGQCIENQGELGCEYDDMILTQNENTGGDICIEFKIECERNENHRLCNGEERTDGIKICDQPDHPAYRFCN